MRFSIIKNLKSRLSQIKDDRNFIRLLQNSFSLLTSNVVVTILQFAQVVILTRFLAPEGYGIFSLVMAYVLMVNQLIDVRVSDMTVRFGSEYIVKQDFDRVAAVVKISYLVDSVTGGLAYLIVVLSAFWASRMISHSGELAQLIQLYATVLLISTLDNTNSAVLRIFDRFNWISAYGAVMSLLELVAITIAVLSGTGIKGVFIALILKDLISAILNSFLAYKTLKMKMGAWRIMSVPLKLIKDRIGEIGRLVWHTNLMAYFRMVNTKVDILILGVFRPPAEVGLYKVARQLATLIGRVSDPFFTAILPDLSRLWEEKKYKAYKQLTRRSSMLLALILVPAGIFLMYISHYVIYIISGKEYLAAAPLVSIGIWGFIVGGIFFWTWPGTISIQRPYYGTRVGFVVAVAQILLSLWLVPVWGALGSVLALLTAYLVGQPLLAWLVWREVTQLESNTEFSERYSAI